ncbi:hypothetical protein [Streptomyces laurentii]|uniref:hypothetical protein n=1 Tax=Streptomyces laurentii TaxID=39478 RepID=UPI0036CEF349
MGWTVLYIAFGVVALWLLGEVLLQYKARLRWRLLAFGGFLGVVLGVLLPSVFVIVIGALAFATGQILVTLSFRSGFSTGWALGGRPGASRRRKAGGEGRQNPTLEVSDLTYEDAHAPDAHAHADAGADPAAGPATAVYATEPMPEDTGNYGVYDGSYGHPTTQAPAHDQTAAFADPYAGAGYGQQQPAYDYGTGGDQQSYAAYSDPYIGGGQPQDGYQQPYADPYAASYGGYDTPPGGVWVPQQRDTEPQQPPYPPQEPQGGYGHYGNGNGNGNGGDQQYR